MGNPEVTVSRQPLVKENFTDAHLFTALYRAEIEKIRDDGLLDFVGPVAHQGDDPGVCFVDLCCGTADRGLSGLRRSRPG
nr:MULTISPECIES: hypothetical protein [unclassified Mycolicibacterium]